MKSVFSKKWSVFRFGDFSYAFFWIAVLSGAILAVFYQPQTPELSIQENLIQNPYFSLFRDMHYFSANFFIITLLLHFWDYFPFIQKDAIKPGRWMTMLFSLFLSFYLMISGFILKGDLDSLLALDVFRGLMTRLPVAGKDLSAFFTGSGSSLMVVYLQHAGIATILTLAIIYEHSRKRWPAGEVFIYSFIVTGVASQIWNAPIKMPYDVVVKGPWYFVAFQEALHHIPQPEYFLSLLAVLFIILYLYDYTRDKTRKIAIGFFLFWFILYLVATVIGLYFRGENWSWVL